MANSRMLAYGAYVLILVLLLFSVLLVPLTAFNNVGSAQIGYQVFAPTCHQKISRSECIFKDQNGAYSVGDCTEQKSVYIDNDNRIISITVDGKVGYKFPVCARDIGIYGGMLLAALIYPFVRKWDSRYVPPIIYFIIALVPLGLDGTWQLLASLGVVPAYESTNTIRLLTGLIAGVAATFYIIPLLMNFIGRDDNPPVPSLDKKSEVK